MSHPFDTIEIGTRIDGVPFSPTRESIREFCEASLDFNPLHLDDEYMKSSFGKTQFGGIIMHGMNNFGVISKTLTDWLYPLGGVHRRLETRWKAPVKPGDTITAQAVVTARKTTDAAVAAVAQRASAEINALKASLAECEGRLQELQQSSGQNTETKEAIDLSLIHI